MNREQLQQCPRVAWEDMTLTLHDYKSWDGEERERKEERKKLSANMAKTAEQGILDETPQFLIYWTNQMNDTLFKIAALIAYSYSTAGLGLQALHNHLALDGLAQPKPKVSQASQGKPKQH